MVNGQPSTLRWIVGSIQENMEPTSTDSKHRSSERDSGIGSILFMHEADHEGVSVGRNAVP